MERLGHSRALRKQLREKRENLGLSQEEVGRRIAALLDTKAEYGRSAISNWERFKKHPSVDAFAAWARVLGVRLLVDIVDDSAATIHMAPGRAESAREYALLDDRDAAYIEQLLAMLPLMDERDRRMLKGDLRRISDEIQMRGQNARASG